MAGLEKRTWIDAVLDFNRAGEFAGDDVDRYSALVDLGHEYSGVAILIPTIENALVSVYAQEDALIATVPKPVHIWKSDNTSALFATSTGTGGIYVACCPLGGVLRYIRLYTSENQTADRTFKVKGIL
jgi:hypothetical protein